MNERSRETGRQRVNVVPFPTSLSTRIFPPWRSTMPRLTDRPSPVPSPSLFVEKKGSKIRRQDGRRNARSRIANFDHTDSFDHGRSDRQHPSVLHRLDRIQHQIHQHLLDHVPIDHDIRQPRDRIQFPTRCGSGQRDASSRPTPCSRRD